MKVSDIGQPRVFLCKSSLFLDKLNKKMGGDGIESKERFGPEEFEVKMNEERKKTETRLKILLVNIQKFNLKLSRIYILIFSHY